MTQEQQDKQLRRIWEKASRQARRLSIPQLDALTKSGAATDRLFALIVMRRQMGNRSPVRGYLSLAKRLIEDTNNNCRWRALIVAGEFIGETPEVVWPIVLRYGSSGDEDMRSGVATILLEHLLDFERLHSTIDQARAAPCRPAAETNVSWTRGRWPCDESQTHFGRKRNAVFADTRSRQ